MTTVTLNETQCLYVRQLLFEELHEAAEILADQAAGAVQGSAGSDNVDGDDAAGTFRHRVQVAAQLLDTIGWSVTTDMTTLVALERKRAVA